MADNQLAQAYSILGQATTAEYKRRRKEEDDYRKRARRDQYLGYLAAPLLKGAGEAIAGGVSDIIGDAVLGDSGKKYFDTEEGLIMARKSKAADNAEKRLLKQRGQLITGGQSAVEGNYNLYESSFRTLLEQQYGSDDKNKVFIDRIVQDNRDALMAAAREGLEEIDGLIAYTSKSPDLDTLAKRAGNKDEFYGQSKGKRALRTLFSKFTGADLAAEGTRYILTGSTDKNSTIRPIYQDLLGDDFEEKLAARVKSVETFRNGKLGNIITEYLQENPELANRLTMAQQASIEERTTAVEFSSEVQELRKMYSKNPLVLEAINSPDGQRAKSLPALQQVIVQKVTKISEGDQKTYGRTYLTNSSNKQAVTALEKAVGRSLFGGLTDSDYEKVKKEGGKDYIDLQKSSQAFIQDVIVPSYAMDLSVALSQLDPNAAAKLALPGAKRELANRYITFQLTQNLERTPDVESKKYFLWGSTTIEQGEQLRQLKSQEGGLRFLMRELASPEQIERLAIAAESTGALQEEQQSNRQMTSPFSMSVNVPEVLDKFNFVGNPAMPRAERESLLNQGIMALTSQIQQRALSQGYRKTDGSANLSNPLLEQLEELERQLYRQIYPDSKSSDYTPVTPTQLMNRYQ
mgnify:CR=1 FL=1